MDNSLIGADAAAVFANHYQFGPLERITNHEVESRAFVWAIRGRGHVRSAGQSWELDPGAVMLLPWRHEVRYEPNRSDPFLVGAVHVVPWHDRGTPVEARAAHGASDPLARSSARRDAEWPGQGGVRWATGSSALQLIRLGEAAVDAFLAGPVPESGMRAFGVLLAQGAMRLHRDHPSDGVEPAALITMREFVTSHLNSRLSTAEIAAVAGVSTSTAERMFRRFTGRSLQAWVRAARLAESGRLLRTTNLRVSQVAVSIGYPDPLYFSRVFSATYGVAPSRFASRTGLL